MSCPSCQITSKFLGGRKHEHPSNLIVHELGKGGPKINALGFGAMGLTGVYGTNITEGEALEVLKAAIEHGSVFIDTSDLYGPPMGTNERLIGNLLKNPEIRKKVFICTKFGIYMDETAYGIRGSKEYVRKACLKSLENLQVDCIDLYYQHRVDRTVDIEETWGELAALQREGKVKHLGISEATPAEIRKAHSIAKISACQIEFSPWTPDIRDNGILDTCRELGIAIVAYSPLGRGFLTGAYKSPEDFAPDDFRRGNPRFQGEAFKENLKLVDALKEIANKKGVTPGQLTLAWVLAQGDDFFAIPGTTKQKYLQENVGTLDVRLNVQDLAAIEEVIKRIKVVGERYAIEHSGVNAF